MTIIRRLMFNISKKQYIKHANHNTNKTVIRMTAVYANNEK